MILWPVPQFRQLRTLTPINYLSADRITIWYIHERCSSACSFTACSPLCNPINIRWVRAKQDQFSALFHSNSTNIDWIANWRAGGERACKTASFTYISYCDMIRTQILNWSQSSEFGKMGLCCMWNPAHKPQLWVWFGFQTTQHQADRFLGGSRTKPGTISSVCLSSPNVFGSAAATLSVRSLITAGTSNLAVPYFICLSWK